MIGRFFEPDEKICLIFDNVNYAKLREIPEFEDEYDYGDMPQAREWADTFEEGIKAFGFSEEQIRRYKDVDRNTMLSAIWNGGANSAYVKIQQNARQGRRTLLLCFYAGHGATKNSKTYALLNSNERVNGENQYSLEAMENGAYVINLFACSRMEMPIDGRRGGTGPVESPGQGITIHAVAEG